MKKRYSIHITAIIIFAISCLIGYYIVFSKHANDRAKLISSTNYLIHEHHLNYYCDIDNDNVSEIFTYPTYANENQPVINQLSSDKEFQHFWHLNKNNTSIINISSADYNNDSIKELFLLTKQENTISLYAIKTYRSNNFLLNDEYICSCPQNSTFIVANNCKLYDINNDGFKDIIISITFDSDSAPQKIICYNIKDKQIIASTTQLTHSINSPIVYDINNDNKPEFFLSLFEHDNKSLFNNNVILNSDLNSFNISKELVSRTPFNISLPFTYNNIKNIAKISWGANQIPELSLISNKGELLKKVVIHTQELVASQNQKDFSKLVLFGRSGAIFKYTKDLKEDIVLDLKEIINQVYYIDINRDNTQEAIVVLNNRIGIIDTKENTISYINIPGIGASKASFLIKEDINSNNCLLVTNNNKQYLIEYSDYKKAQTHFIISGIALIVTLFVIGFMLLCSKLNSGKKSEDEIEVMKLQVGLIKNQLDPHFLFNALNSISFSINTSDKKNAYYNLGVFSKMMRQAIGEMEEFYRNLEDEIAFVKHYLHLEKFRFKEQFNYHIIISPQVKQSSTVPKMCLFCYVEGSLKKGILPKQTGGNIEIKIDSNKDSDLILSIRDDGIHRDVAIYKSSLSNSMMAMQQIINYYNKYNDKDITINFTDLGSAEEPKGSQIIMTIPFGFQF